MNITEIPNVLESLEDEIAQIEIPGIKAIVSLLLNLVEEFVSEMTRLRRENQELKDTINVLKGEQGKPEIKANTRKNENISSEQERKEAERSEDTSTVREGFKLDQRSLDRLKEQRIPVEVLEALERLHAKKYSHKAEFLRAVESVIGEELTAQYGSVLLKYARYEKRNRPPKLPEIVVDREEICTLDTALLPEDAEFKGYAGKIVQDLLITTDNVRFQRELYYSPSLKKSYRAAVPQGYEGGYGPHIKAQIVSFKYVNNMSIPKIEEFYDNMGILISDT